MNKKHPTLKVRLGLVQEEKEKTSVSNLLQNKLELQEVFSEEGDEKRLNVDRLEFEQEARVSRTIMALDLDVGRK